MNGNFFKYYRSLENYLHYKTERFQLTIITLHVRIGVDDGLVLSNP